MFIITSGVHIDVSLVSDVPGKLDHASIVAYEVGYHGPPRSPKEKKLLTDSGSMNKLKFQIYSEKLNHENCSGAEAYFKRPI